MKIVSKTGKEGNTKKLNFSELFGRMVKNQAKKNW